MKPFIDLSIITVCYNSSKIIEPTLKSIQEAKKKFDFEYLVIDGASKDNTLGVVKEYQSCIDILVSETDKGIYDAMNKGIKKATRNYVLFINSDDLVIPEAFDALAKAINKNKFDILAFGVNITNEKGDLLRTRTPAISSRKKKYFGMPTHHQGLISRRFFEGKLIQFNTQYRICADYDLLTKMILKTDKIYKDPTPVAIFRKGGVSSSSYIRVENFKIEQSHHGLIWAILSVSYTALSLSLQKMLPKHIVKSLRDKF